MLGNHWTSFFCLSGLENFFSCEFENHYIDGVEMREFEQLGSGLNVLPFKFRCIKHLALNYFLNFLILEGGEAGFVSFAFGMYEVLEVFCSFQVDQRRAWLIRY